MRYVERNALRANLVKYAEDWPWCSLAMRLGGEASSLDKVNIASGGINHAHSLLGSKMSTALFLRKWEGRIDTNGGRLRLGSR